ncbi:glycosyltransferase family 2 protein [Paenibacillus sp. JMULE4]|uniref:glycosyltransferase n=1 Tax=Paenibacillus sp. JMULE4 TaxID=2518342 RepID=UPI0015761FCB|nr:glycosyltransferase family A protein [Paenibacillus sp. JMULE4]NTZ16646.1 glycosyltransferase family 2 protein [Paenibacillus sp. JMULE4]
MGPTTQSIERLFKSIVAIKSAEDEKKSISELLDIPDYGKCFLMGLRDRFSKGPMEGVTMITCTNKPDFIGNIFQNYQNQCWSIKELIIILNRDDMDVHRWKRRAKRYDHVSVYQLPQEASLGYCYNFAVEKARYDYIATFDDDDFYAPHYLTDLMHAFQYTDADIVGKLTYYLYLETKQILAIRNRFQEYKYLDADSFLDGGKKIVKRKVYDHVRNRDVSINEDVYFCQDSMEKGFKIFSADKYNLVYLRRSNKDSHTWKEDDDTLLGWCSVAARTKRYKSRVII